MPLQNITNAEVKGKPPVSTVTTQKSNNNRKVSGKRSVPPSPSKVSCQKRTALGDRTNVHTCIDQVQKEHTQPQRLIETRKSARLHKKLFQPSAECSISVRPSTVKTEKYSQRPANLQYTDVDSGNLLKVHEVADYAFTVFEYMRARESCFPICPSYMDDVQDGITWDMRAILVDWMVEVQENFELNHESLYLAVKLVDFYLQKVSVPRHKLQLVGATAIFLAAKFDERRPPYADEILYVCDGSYTKREFFAMERTMLVQVGYDINIPVSYRFLRRYAKCSCSSMETLTLARYVLELSLQSHLFVHCSASLLAAAALWLAFKMKTPSSDWDDTLIHYSSHTEPELIDLASQLNHMLQQASASKLKTVIRKYSHQIFYQVAKTEHLSDERLLAERLRISDCRDVTTTSSPPSNDGDELFTRL